MAKLNRYNFSSDLASINNPDDISLTVVIPAGTSVSGGNSIVFTDTKDVKKFGTLLTKFNSSLVNPSRQVFSSQYIRTGGTNSNGYMINAYVRYISKTKIELRVVIAHTYIVFSPNPPANVNIGSGETITARVRTLDIGF